MEGYDKRKWNSVVHKTPISASSNREIGGYAPSVYLEKLEKKGPATPADLDGYVETHWTDHNLLRADDFLNVIIDRAKTADRYRGSNWQNHLRQGLG